MKFSKCLICLFMIVCLNIVYIYATESSNISNVEADEAESIEIQEQKSELKKEVSSLIEELRYGITEIDEKIEELKKTDEYISYPTIRLNIDTPIFGIKSIINQKLRITKDVSAGDVAKGYSIRYIVKNKLVKIPDLKVGNIIVSTKEIDIESDLLITEYNSLILKLINYKDKVESVQEFLDIQTNKMFKDYVSNDKKEKLRDFSDRLEKIDSDLLKVNYDLTKVFLSEYEKYSELNKEYIELATMQKELKNELSDVLIESDKLNNLQKNIITLESDVIDYVAKIYSINNDLNKIKIDKVYLKAYNNLKNRLDYIEKYIKDSEIEKDIKEDISKSEDKTSNEDDKVTEIVTIYEVFSDKSINNMKNILLNLEKSMDELDIAYKEKNKDIDSEENSQDGDKASKIIDKLAFETLTDEEIDEELGNIIQKYNEFLKSEYTFYLDNVNGLLNLTNTKIKNIASVTDADLISEAKYVYIELPLNLEKYLDLYNSNSGIEIKYLISNFKNELVRLSDNYIELNELYKKLDIDKKLNNT